MMRNILSYGHEERMSTTVSVVVKCHCEIENMLFLYENEINQFNQ